MKFYPDRHWGAAFVGGSYEFLNNGERMLDARTQMHYYATGITPAMAFSKPSTGSAYAARDSMGHYLDGGKTDKITLPAPIPVGQFWSFMVYDVQTRSMLETDQKLAGLDSNRKDIRKNADGSVTVWFGPKASTGQETNWVQTMPGKAWKPGDFELVQSPTAMTRPTKMTQESLQLGCCNNPRNAYLRNALLSKYGEKRLQSRGRCAELHMHAFCSDVILCS